MTFLSIGDLAQSFQLRRDTARVQGDLLRLSGELSSGLRSDLAAATAGDLGPLAAIERDLDAVDAFTLAAKEAKFIGEVANDVLGRISDDLGVSAATLLMSETLVQPALVDNAASDARQRFDSAVAALNTQVAGRSLFSGQAYDTAPLADADAILGDLYVVVSVETTVEAALAAIDTWFAPGGAFETTAYLGSSADAPPVRLGDGAVAQPTLRAADPRIVESLKSFASAALLDLGLFAGSPNLRADMARTSGERLLSASDDLNAARAAIGEGQQAVERARVRLESERSAFELARNEIVSADPFETAVRLQEAQSQLETLYIVMSRLSAMSLAGYLR